MAKNYQVFRCLGCGREDSRFWTAKKCSYCQGDLENVGDNFRALNAEDGVVVEQQRRKPEQREHAEQVALFQWVGVKQNRYPVLKMLHASPNGGKRHISVALKLQAEGVRAGVLDLHLPAARQGFHGLWIEMKAKGGALTKTGKDGSWGQVDWARELKAEGNRVEVCWSSLEAIRVIMDYLGIPASEADDLFE